MSSRIASTPLDPQALAMMIAGFRKPASGGLPWLNVAAYEKLAEMGADFVDFLGERLHEDVKMQHAILHCRDANALMQLQQAFIRTAIDQYTSQTGRVVGKTNELMAAMMLPTVD